MGDLLQALPANHLTGLSVGCSHDMLCHIGGRCFTVLSELQSLDLRSGRDGSMPDLDQPPNTLVRVAELPQLTALSIDNISIKQLQQLPQDLPRLDLALVLDWKRSEAEPLLEVAAWLKQHASTVHTLQLY
jgi:hypothetical protein